MVQPCSIGLGCTMRCGRWRWGQVAPFSAIALAPFWMIISSPTGRGAGAGAGHGWSTSRGTQAGGAIAKSCTIRPDRPGASLVLAFGCKRCTHGATMHHLGGMHHGGSNKATERRRGNKGRVPNGEYGTGGEIACAGCTIGAGRMVRGVGARRGAGIDDDARHARSLPWCGRGGRPVATGRRRGKGRG
jgi:hypothetical protein